MRRPRFLLLLVLAASLALAAPGVALGQQGGRPSAGELWQRYPLQPKGGPKTSSSPAATTPRGTPSSPVPATVRPGASSGAADGGNTSGLLVAVLAALALLTLAAAGGATSLVVLNRRRSSSGAAHAAPAPPVRGRPRTVSLFTDAPPEPEPEPEPDLEPDPEPAPEPDLALGPEAEELLPPDPGRAWTAETVWQHDDGRCRFCVFAVEDGGEISVAVARSSWLGWPPSDDAPVSELADAVRAIEAALAQAGWSPLEPGPAWYAKRFAWAPVGAEPAPVSDGPPAAGAIELDGSEPPERFAREPEWPEGSEKRWRCEIRWDSGYVSSRFEAVALAPTRRKARLVGASPSFRWLLMSDPDPRTPEHDEAVSALQAALLDAGWEPAGRGAEWYAERFVWPRDGAPPQHIRPASSGAGRSG